MNKIIINEILKQLLNFDDEISFNKSKNTLDTANKSAMDRIYDFKNCCFGDKVYYSKDLGINLISGEYIGYCALMAGENPIYPNSPLFVYKEDVIDPDLELPMVIKYDEAISVCNKLSKKYGIDFRLPSREEGAKEVRVGVDFKLGGRYWTDDMYNIDHIWQMTVMPNQLTGKLVATNLAVSKAMKKRIRPVFMARKTI